MSIVAVFNQKGGVGKTTTVLNLAAVLMRRGRLPLGIDFDPLAHLSAITDVAVTSGDETALSLFQRNRPLQELIKTSASGLRVIPSHIELSKVDTLFGKGYNVVNRLNSALIAEKLHDAEHPILMDCCPMVGVLSLNAIFACEGVIVPVSADYLSFKGALQIDKTLKALEQVLKRRVKRRYLLTRFDRRRRMGWDVQQQLLAQFGDEVCRTVIAENVSLAESPLHKKTVYDYAPNSRGAKDYEELLDELLSDGFMV